MFGKVFIICLSLVALLEAKGLCPDAKGEITDGTTDAGVECEVIPGCNFPENGTLTPLATQCSNDLADTDCEALFACTDGNTAPDPNCNPKTTASTAGDPTTYPMVRAQTCTSPSVRDVAMKCAKTCALCCQAPEFNCDDDVKSPVDCELNKGKCKDANWTDIMAQYCPMTCGLCDEGGCRDLNSGCNTVTELCKNVDFIDYMRANCARTCDFCATTSPGCTNKATNCAENANLCTNDIYRQLMQEQCCATCGGTSGGGSTSCTDSSTSCTTWVKNGFCTSSYYTSDQKRQYCGRSCNLC